MSGTTKIGSGGGDGPSLPPGTLVLVDMQKILLRKCFASSQEAGVNIKPLTKQLSMLFGDVSVAQGVLAMLGDSLSKMPEASQNRTTSFQLLLLQEHLQSIESTLSVLLSAAETGDRVAL